jgi:hypothetical protein
VAPDEGEGWVKRGNVFNDGSLDTAHIGDYSIATYKRHDFLDNSCYNPHRSSYKDEVTILYRILGATSGNIYGS